MLRLLPNLRSLHIKHYHLRACDEVPARPPQDDSQQKNQEQLEDQQGKHGLTGTQQGGKDKDTSQQPEYGGIARAQGG